MTWSILYHHSVEEDLESIGPSAARRIVKAIDAKLTRSPMQFGAPLSGNLADFRKLRVGDYRVVYQVREKRSWSMCWLLDPGETKKFTVPP